MNDLPIEQLNVIIYGYGDPSVVCNRLDYNDYTSSDDTNTTSSNTNNHSCTILSHSHPITHSSNLITYTPNHYQSIKSNQSHNSYTHTTTFNLLSNPYTDVIKPISSPLDPLSITNYPHSITCYYERWIRNQLVNYTESLDQCNTIIKPPFLGNLWMLQLIRFRYYLLCHVLHYSILCVVLYYTMCCIIVYYVLYCIILCVAL